MRRIVQLSLACTIASVAQGQWNALPSVNNPVCVQAYDQQDVKVASDAKGGAIMTWLDYRADATMINGDIYAQRIDANGNIKWTLNGVAVCNAALHQTAPVISEDGVGGVFIAWVDERNGNKDIYAQRLDSMGNVLWAANGIAVAAKTGHQDNPRVIKGGSGALFIWEDDSLMLGDANLFVQNVSAVGSVIWGASGYRVCTLSGAQINPRIAEDGAGGAVITWQDKRNGSDYDIYAQRINSSGQWQWTANGAALCLFASTQSNPKLIADGSGGAIVAWQDKRSGIDFDIYAQYVNGSGVAQWTNGGKVICNSLGAQSAIDMAGDVSTNGAMIFWKDARNTHLDIFGQKVDYSGTTQWTANGLAVCNSANDQINPNSVSDGAGGAIVVWQDSLLSNYDIRAQRIGSAGTLMWTSGGLSIGTAAFNQTSPKNVADGSGGSVFCWQDKRNGTDFDIYASKVDASGTLVSVQQLQDLASKVQVTPIPSSGPVQFDLSAASVGSFLLEVYDMKGGKILSEYVQASSHTIQQKLPAGLYQYRILAKGKLPASGKFIIQ